MCATIPGLIFSSICVHILELNQFPRSVTVCPRIEIVSKKERWQISYICSSLSTVLPTMPVAMMMMAMPTGVMSSANRPISDSMIPGMGQPMPPSMMQNMKPAVATPGMPMGQVISPGSTTTAQKIPGTTTMQMPARPTMIQTATSSAMIPIISAPILAGVPAIVQLPAVMATGQMPGMRLGPTSAPTVMGQLTAGTPAMMAQLMPSSVPTMAQIPTATPTMMKIPIDTSTLGPMPKTSVLPVDRMQNSSLMKSRKVNTLVDKLHENPSETQRKPIMLTDTKHSHFHNLSAASRSKRPLVREILKRKSESNEKEKVLNVESKVKSFQINNNSIILNDEKTGIDSPESVEKLLNGNQSILTVMNNAKDNTDTKKLAKSVASTDTNLFPNYLRRVKRNVDMFDILHQTNKCERAYRICITRSKHYIVSRLNKPRINGPTKNIDCSNNPAKIVHGLNENLCSRPPFLNDFINLPLNIGTNTAISPGDKKPPIQINDSLQAIIVYDESAEGSEFLSQNEQHIIPSSFYDRPAIFPSRTPPFTAPQMGQLLKTSRHSNDTFILDGESGHYS